MRFTPFPAVACLIGAVAAQTSSTANPFKIPSNGYVLTAGQPTTLNWTPTTSGTVTLTLRQGASSNLDQGTVIASSILNSGSYSYTPPANTVDNSDYQIEISSDSDSSDVNYTGPLVINSSNTVEPISTISSASASTASVSPSSSIGSSTSPFPSSSSTFTSSSKLAISTASLKSATTSSSSSSGSSVSAAGTSTSGSSKTSSSAGIATQAATQATTAPHSGASVMNVLSIQGGFLAIILGAMAAF